MIERKIDYIISTYPSKNEGYQSKRNKGLEAKIKLFISTMWKNSFNYANDNCNLLEIKNYDDFFNYVLNLFIDDLNFTIILERYCLELCFNKIRIKNGKCNNCIVYKPTIETMRYLNE